MGDPHATTAPGLSPSPAQSAFWRFGAIRAAAECSTLATMWLPWDYALLLAVACLGGSRLVKGRSAAILKESAILASLYALWQLAGRLSVMQIDGAVERGLWIWDLQAALGFPSEAAWQSAVLDHTVIIQAANIYYGGAHVPGMGIFLAWMFLAQREDYAVWRISLALSTAVCLLIQLLPVAPPRLISELGMVDTGIAHGQSVYAAFGNTIAGQLQAMPSIHVGWAVLIAAACWSLGGPVARAIGLSHALMTTLVVVITANHYWLDGLVAALIVAAIVPVSRKLGELFSSWSTLSFAAVADPTSDLDGPPVHSRQSIQGMRFKERAG